MNQKEQLDIIEKARAKCEICGYARYIPFRWRSNPDGSIPKSDRPKLNMKSPPAERLIGVIEVDGEPRCACSDCAKLFGQPFLSIREHKPRSLKDPNQLELV